MAHGNERHVQIGFSGTFRGLHVQVYTLLWQRLPLFCFHNITRCVPILPQDTESGFVAGHEGSQCPAQCIRVLQFDRSL